MKPRCEFCTHCWDDYKRTRSCRRFPPQVIRGKWRFPAVHPLDCCGEYKENPAQVKERGQEMEKAMAYYKEEALV